MADYLVKQAAGAVGTATGDAGRYATPQTGAFSALPLGLGGHYPTIATALAATTTPVNGDRVLVSSAHDFDAGSSSITYTLTIGVTIEIICVDDANMENYRAAEGARGSEYQSSGTAADISFNGNFVIRGLYFGGKDDVFIQTSGEIG